jgi:hypothetical protein
MSQFPSKTNPSKLKIYRCKILTVITCRHFDTRQWLYVKWTSRDLGHCVANLHSALSVWSGISWLETAYVTQFSIHLSIRYTQCNVGYMCEIFIIWQWRNVRTSKVNWNESPVPHPSPIRYLITCCVYQYHCKHLSWI